MPVKVKVKGDTEEENDVKQIAQAIGEVLNRGVSVKRGENEYKDEYVLYLQEPTGQKEHSIAFLAPKEDKTTGDYTVRLLFDALKVSTGGYNPSKTMPNNPAQQFSTLVELMPAIVGEMKEHLKDFNFNITDSKVGQISFILELKKQSSV